MFRSDPNYFILPNERKQKLKTTLYHQFSNNLSLNSCLKKKKNTKLLEGKTQLFYFYLKRHQVSSPRQANDNYGSINCGLVQSRDCYNRFVKLFLPCNGLMVRAAPHSLG